MRKTRINSLSENNIQQHRAIVKSTYLTFLFLLFCSPTFIFGILYFTQTFSNTISIYDPSFHSYKNSSSALYLILAMGYTYLASNFPILLLTNKVFFNEAKNDHKEFVNFLIRIRTRIYHTIVQMTTIMDT
jgi:hypothetical protein